LLYGFPPKIIWLRVGNQATKAIKNLLVSHASEFHLFLQNQEEALLILG